MKCNFFVVHQNTKATEKREIFLLSILSALFFKESDATVAIQGGFKKGYYRRGQSRVALQKLKKAVGDCNTFFLLLVILNVRSFKQKLNPTVKVRNIQNVFLFFRQPIKRKYETKG